MRRPPTTSALLHRLGVDLRPGEATLCWRLFTLHFLLLTFQYAAKSIRQSSFVDTLGAERLPYVYLLVAVAAFPVLRLHGHLVDRFGERRVLIGACLAVASGMVFFWLGFETDGAWLSVAFYLWIAIVGLLLISQFWCFAGGRLGPRQARRLFGFIGAGGLLGGVAGGQLARFAGAWSGTRDGLLMAALALLLAACLVPRDKATRDSAAKKRHIAVDAAAEHASFGARALRRSPYLRWLAGIMLLSATVAQFVDLQLSWAVEQSTASLDARTAVFGTLYSVMGLVAFVFQLLFTARIHRRAGVATALRVLPAGTAIGSLGLLAAAAFAKGWILAAAAVLKVGENGLRYSLDQATRELLFLPLPAELRPRAKAFLDVFVQRLGRGVAGVLLLTVTFGWLGVAATAWLSLALAALWLGLVGGVRRRYVAACRDALGRPCDAALDVDARLDLTDSATLERLVAGLASGDRRELLHTLELLILHHKGHLVPPTMLEHRDPEVRRKVLAALSDSRRADAAADIARRLTDDVPEVRGEAARALATLRPRVAREAMADRLDDADPGVRAAAAGYLAACGRESARERGERRLGEMLADGDPAVRREAARALGTLAEPTFQAELIRLLYDAVPEVVAAALGAVEQRATAARAAPLAASARAASPLNVSPLAVSPLYLPILVARLHDRRLKHAARAALVAYGESVLPALGHFLRDRQEPIWVRRALPKTVAALPGPAALETLIGGLRRARDPFLRRKTIRALASLRRHDAELRPPDAAVDAEIAGECRAFLATWLDLTALRRVASAGDHLLLRLLEDRLDDHHGNVLALLVLVVAPADARAARRAFASRRGERRGRALELLDNLLSGERRRRVLAIIDDVTDGARERLADRLFGLRRESVAATLERLAGPPADDDPDAAWRAAAAVHFIAHHGPKRLYPIVDRAAKDRHPLLRETAARLTRFEIQSIA